MVESLEKAFYGQMRTHLGYVKIHLVSGLRLQDGALDTANTSFRRCFALSLKNYTNLALECAARLGDLSSGMNRISATFQWSVIFLALALKCQDKCQTMQAFRCLGQLFSVQGDDETALSLFNVALDGFTFMDIHRWRADCMVRIADILNSGGEVLKVVELWKAARPLFERSSQKNDVAKLDDKLAGVDSATLAEYEDKLQRLAEVCVPSSAPEAEEEENELAQTLEGMEKFRFDQFSLEF
ncbi:hypothetical protein C8J57DRAFT_1252791 [Mycena rebaudengoi]|nr:hypothetical protein C8J57DRAFT_1252791 [Mycena rebaudengoi]